jgi:hypothetical protein
MRAVPSRDAVARRLQLGRKNFAVRAYWHPIAGVKCLALQQPMRCCFKKTKVVLTPLNRCPTRVSSNSRRAVACVWRTGIDRPC